MESINWVEVVLTAGLLYGAIEARARFASWRFKRWKAKMAKSGTELPDISERGRNKNASKPVQCSKCGLRVKDYVEYRDEDIWCESCDLLYEE